MPLNSNQVKSMKPGVYSDGGGLYLVVRESGDRVWSYRFTGTDGKRAAMEFATFGDKPGEMTLSAARDQAREYRLALKKDGVDPRHRKKITIMGGKTFAEYWKDKVPGWCAGKHKDEPKNWERSLSDLKSMHHLKLHEIESTHVIDALKPIWWKKPVTANRTRERLERILDAAKVEKYRAGDNPAVWRGNLKHIFPSARKLNKKKAHASVEYTKAPSLLLALKYDPSRVARCVEVGILTVARSQEIRLMQWDEVDFDKETWLVPAERMKVKGQSEPKPHLVPLSKQAIEIIQSMPRDDRYVFPSDHAEDHQPFLPNALVNCIRRAGFAATMHGMRSTFRNWGGDCKEHNFRREVLEHCLAHRVGDESERSYWTGEMLDRRREVLNAWATYVRPPDSTTPVQHRPNLKIVA